MTACWQQVEAAFSKLVKARSAPWYRILYFDKNHSKMGVLALILGLPQSVKTWREAQELQEILRSCA
jgi:hypothetical protein